MSTLLSEKPSFRSFCLVDWLRRFLHSLENIKYKRILHGTSWICKLLDDESGSQNLLQWGIQNFSYKSLSSETYGPNTARGNWKYDVAWEIWIKFNANGRLQATYVLGSEQSCPFFRSTCCVSSSGTCKDSIWKEMRGSEAPAPLPSHRSPTKGGCSSNLSRSSYALSGRLAMRITRIELSNLTLSRIIGSCHTFLAPHLYNET